MPIADMPQSNKMHAVPQNIMDVEFKLIGDLTLRQFMYLLFFGAVSYAAYVAMVGIFKYPITFSLAILGICLAFIPVQERGLDEWLVNFIKSVYSPTQRIWRREPTLPSVFMYENLAVVKQELITLAPTSSRRRLEEYLEYRLRDEVVDPLDIPEKEYMARVREAFANYERNAPSVGVSVLEPQVELSPEFPPAANVPPQISQEQPESQDSQAPTSVLPLQPEPVEVKTEAKKTSEVKNETKTEVKEVKQAAIPVVQTPKEHKQRPINLGRSSSPMTPDRHSGRRFINLVPSSGELVLPIRGERVLQTSEELEIEDDIQEKAEKLQQLLSQIKRESGVTVIEKAEKQEFAKQISPAGFAEPTTAVPEAKSLADKLQLENSRLTGEIQKLQDQKNVAATPSEAQEKDTMIHRLQTEKERTQADFESLQRQILELQNKLKEQQFSQHAQEPKATITSPTFIPTPHLTGKANIVFGVVKSQDGTARDTILLIMKNQRGEAVRAFKTNSLGQFKLSTPLSNGIYTIEITNPKPGETFDIISVEAKGEPIPSIEIIGH